MSDRESVSDRSPAPDPRLRLAGEQVKQALPNVPPIELKGLMLIAETHQALVARGVAVGMGVVSCFVKVAAPKALSGDLADRVRLFDQSTEHACTAFRSLREQQRSMLP